MSELAKGRASYHKTFATNIQMAVLPKVRSALFAASQVPGREPLMHLHLHVNQNPDDDECIKKKFKIIVCICYVSQTVDCF